MNGIPHQYKPLRWKIAVLLCLAAGLNYMDRNTLAILAGTIQRELHFSDRDYANITAAFVFSYTVMYAISGRIIDRIGSKKGLSLAVGGWSVISILHAIARTAGQFTVVRFLLGITESANFPAGVKTVAEWFPLRERALAIGIFNAGAALGAAVAAPVVSFAALYFGWRAAFVVTGVLGLVWVLAWARQYHLPGTHPRISPEEKALIDAEPGVAPGAAPRVPIKSLLVRKATWGCFAARILIDPVTYFLLFWIPKFLQDKRGFTLRDVGATVWIPYLALGIGTILGGAIPKWLIERRGWSLDRSRKSVMALASVAIPVLCVLLYAGASATLAISAIAGIMLCHGLWSNITLPTEIYPRGVQATITGLGGTLGGITGFLSQQLIGATIDRYSYLPMFTYLGLVYLVTFFLVLWLIGRLGVIRQL